MSQRIKSKTRDSALPRKRSTAALSLQSAQHRQQVIPDKRRASNERAMNEEVRAVALGLEPLGRIPRKSDPALRAAINRKMRALARCTDWKTGTDYGACKDVRCEYCTINFDKAHE